MDLMEVHCYFVVEVETSVLSVEPLAASHLRSVIWLYQEIFVI